MKEYTILNGGEFKLLFYFRQNSDRMINKRLTTEFLAKTLALSERTIKNGIKTLEYHKFISVVRSPKGNKFTLISNQWGE